MVYAIKKKINNSVYYYAVISVRVGDKVKLKTIKFLGKEGELNKAQIQKLLEKIPKKRIEQAKQEVKESAGVVPKQKKKILARKIKKSKHIVKQKKQQIKKKASKPKKQKKPKEKPKKGILNIFKKRSAKQQQLEELKKAFK